MKLCVLIVYLMICCFARTVVLQSTESESSFNQSSTESAQCCQQSSDVIATLTEAVKRLSDKLEDVYLSVKKCDKDVDAASLWVPRDCSDICKVYGRTSGIYKIFSPFSSSGLSVYCDMCTSRQDWLVIQRRKDGSENFERTWLEYAYGFGNLYGEFWLGNDILHVLTNAFNYKLRIDLEDFEGQKRYAEYSTFKVASSADNYRLTVSGYSGDAGDSFSGHNGSQFSTKDADHDTAPAASCAQVYHGAWWYKSCHSSNLNGLYLHGNHTTYADGIEWRAFRGYNHSMKFTEMKIARV